MNQTLNIDNFVIYLNSTGKYTRTQLEKVSDAFYMFEDENLHISPNESGYRNSHDYIFDNMAKSCRKLQTYMQTAGINKPKAEAVIKDFKKWVKAFLE